MAGRSVGRSVWMKQAEDTRLKEEEQKAAAAKAAFEATFKSLENKAQQQQEEEAEEAEQEEADKPIGPVDPAKCTAAGTGVGGGAAGSAVSFVVVTKDSEGRRLPHGGLEIKVRIREATVGEKQDQEALVKDNGDGTYTVTYAVAKRGNYTVSVECSGQPISGSPFPVFFSGGGGILAGGGASGFVNGVSHTSFPNMMMVQPGIFPGMQGMISGIGPGANGGVVLPGLGAAFGEVCRDYLNGRCGKNDCKYSHPPHNQLMAALSAGNTMGAPSQKPMGPSAAAIAAAQTIVAAQALQAHAASSRGQFAGESSGSYHCLASSHFPLCPSGFEMLKAYCIVGFNLPDWPVMAIFNVMMLVTLTLKHTSSSLKIIVVLETSIIDILIAIYLKKWNRYRYRYMAIQWRIMMPILNLFNGE